MENQVSKLFDEMQNMLNDSQGDVTKFCEGNNSAGTRVRKTMQAIKALAQEVRTEVQEQKTSVMA